MEDDEELEEEEEGMDEEDEEEEMSDLADEELYDGEYEEYDEEEEEGEELEEEEEEEDDEDGDIPPLEGAEEKAGEMGIEEGKVLQAAAVDEGEMAGFSMEGDSEGGIEEVHINRALFGEDRMKMQEVESIGVLEEAREGEGDEDESERMDDPTMPQILCVTGSALEDRDETEEEGAGSGGRVVQEGASSWEERANEIETTASSEDHTTSPNKEVGTSVLRCQI